MQASVLNTSLMPRQGCSVYLLMLHQAEHSPQSPKIAMPQHQSCLCVYAQLLKASRFQQRHTMRQQRAHAALQRLLPQPPELCFLRLIHNVLQALRQVRASAGYESDAHHHLHAPDPVLLADSTGCSTMIVT